MSNCTQRPYLPRRFARQTREWGDAEYARYTELIREHGSSDQAVKQVNAERGAGGS